MRDGRDPATSTKRRGRVHSQDAGPIRPIASHLTAELSHDRDLLDGVDQVAELRDGTVTCYGGNLTDYEHRVAVEQAAAQRAVRAAESEVRHRQAERSDARTRAARRARMGRKAAAEGRMPKIVAGARQRHAEESAGRTDETHQRRLAAARTRLAEAEGALRDPDAVRIDLPATDVPARRRVLACAGVNVAVGSAWLWSHDVALRLRGPERVALVGPNGGGKTTLLRCVARVAAPSRGTIARGVDTIAYLPQRLDGLDPARSVLEHARRAAPAANVNAVRARLARFGFRGDAVEQAAGTLSGGERFRVVLALLLGGDPPPQLLVLDEPTNNLDLHSVAQLHAAVRGYRGALLVASHDETFLERLGVDRTVHLDRDHGLVDGDAPPR